MNNVDNVLDPRDLISIARAVNERSTPRLRRSFIFFAVTPQHAIAIQERPTMRIPRIVGRAP